MSSGKSKKRGGKAKNGGRPSGQGASENAKLARALLKATMDSQSRDRRARRRAPQRDPGEMRQRARGRREGAGIKRLPAELLALTRTQVPSYDIRTQVHSDAGPATLQHYLASLAHPRQVRGMRSPIDINVAPSVATLTCTTVTRFAQAVSANQASQIVWFPGHSINTGQMHPSYTSSHPINVNGNAAVSIGVAGTPSAVVSGPVAVATTPAVACIATTVLAAGVGSTDLTSNAGATGVVIPVIWDTPTGLQAPLATDYWHRPVSACFRITNTTPAGNVSGTVVTVTPGMTFDVNTATPNQEAWAIFPTYQINDPAGTVEMTWVPRATDLGYWGYPSPTSGASSGIRDAGMLVWLNAASTTQTYIIELVVNWEIGGSAYRTLAQPTALSPSATSVAKQIVSQVHAGTTNVKGMLEAGLEMANSLGSYVPMAARAAQRIAGAAASITY